ncbi:carboxypeptidase regulatory-like domain-containing protein [bacterium]|nr:carboxypeptidase regulatory-like domain-containing protein [bacterium]
MTPDDPPIEMALTPGVPNARAQLGTFGPVVEVGGRRIPLTPPPPAHPAGATPPAAGPETSTPGFKVSCAVVMPNRTAVQGLMVELLKEGEIQPQDLFEKPRTMPTDPRGVAVFHGIPPGAYTAIVRPEGQVKGDWERLGLPAGVAQAQVHVRDRDVLGILLRFESSTEAGAGVIAGVVQDAQGKPWGDNVRVRLFRNEGRGGQPAAPDVRTDLGGRFRFVNISPGSYEIMTMTTGTYGDDDPGLSCMTPRFMLAAGESREDIVMVMDIGATIRGCATDRQGKPLGRIVDIIAMQRTDKGLRFVARSRHMASDGSYVFTQLPAGELLLFDWSGAYLTTVTAERGKTIENLNFAYDAVPEHKVYMGMEQQMLKAP